MIDAHDQTPQTRGTTVAGPFADEAIASAPLPTERTLRRRRNVLVQVVRFVAINLKMIRVIARGHG